MDLESHFLAKLAPLVESGHTTFTIAYSGGVDSHVLLVLMHQLKSHYPSINIKAVHVHHGLSPNAERWLEHCQRVCAELDIEFDGRKVKVDLGVGLGLEGAAREARYKCLQEVSEPDSVVLLGQHQNDQVETFLLQLKRGAGPKRPLSHARTRRLALWTKSCASSAIGSS